jgi:hypothetical protein
METVLTEPLSTNQDSILHWLVDLLLVQTLCDMPIGLFGSITTISAFMSHYELQNPRGCGKPLTTLQQFPQPKFESSTCKCEADLCAPISPQMPLDMSPRGNSCSALFTRKELWKTYRLATFRRNTISGSAVKWIHITDVSEQIWWACQ